MVKAKNVFLSGSKISLRVYHLCLMTFQPINRTLSQAKKTKEYLIISRIFYYPAPMASQELGIFR